MLNISSTNIGLESVTMIATSSLFDEHKILSSLDLLKLSEESKKKLAEIGLEVPALDDKKAMFTLVFDNLITQLQEVRIHLFSLPVMRWGMKRCKRFLLLSICKS